MGYLRTQTQPIGIDIQVPSLPDLTHYKLQEISKQKEALDRKLETIDLIQRLVRSFFVKTTGEAHCNFCRKETKINKEGDCSICGLSYTNDALGKL